ncbi:ATP-grasp domain-containing protein [Crateriforma conspicua]|uniref:ATP-grasp domain-containing protein n=1 Tax=Crateriforma conspicua TaxID=2527996 RepID=UPI00118D4C1E|nr:ATP-grasp domain-containing protein [Crateriforma conspicua]QDV62789.1 ATP-grasp domain protein [Crateriforma conspicua]
MQAPDAIPGDTEPPPDHRDSPAPSTDSAAVVGKVILMGASVRSAAASARRGGLRIWGIDRFGDADTRDLCEEFQQISGPDQIAAALRRAKARWPDAAVVAAGDLITPPDVEVDQGRWCEAKTIRCRDLWAQAAGVSDCRFPATRPIVDEASTAHQHRRQSVDHDRWLEKSMTGTGGLGVRWSDPNRKFQPGMTFQQQWVAGRTHGVTYIADGAEARMLGVCRTITTRFGDLPFIYAGSLGPVSLQQSTQDRLQRLGQSLVERTRYRGLFNADVVLSGDQPPWLLEVNPRWSASMELVEHTLAPEPSGSSPATQPSLIRWHVRAQSERLHTWVRVPNPNHSIHRFKRIVYSLRAGRLCSQAIQRWCRQLHAEDQSIRCTDIPAQTDDIAIGQPIVTLTGILTPQTNYRDLIRQVQSLVS